jgi:hypothetical protein
VPAFAGETWLENNFFWFAHQFGKHGLGTMFPCSNVFCFAHFGLKNCQKAMFSFPLILGNIAIENNVSWFAANL